MVVSWWLVVKVYVCFILISFVLVLIIQVKTKTFERPSNRSQETLHRWEGSVSKTRINPLLWWLLLRIILYKSTFISSSLFCIQDTGKHKIKHKKQKREHNRIFGDPNTIRYNAAGNSLFFSLALRIKVANLPTQ